MLIGEQKVVEVPGDMLINDKGGGSFKQKLM
jgi:hypothetical protein